MVVTYVIVYGRGHVMTENTDLFMYVGYTGSECHWFVPGTVDPNE